MSAESIGPTAFPGVAWPRDAKPTPPGAAGSTADQNRIKPHRARPFGLRGELKSESKKEIPVDHFLNIEKWMVCGRNEKLSIRPIR